jgi:hypothetical protein
VNGPIVLGIYGYLLRQDVLKLGFIVQAHPRASQKSLNPLTGIAIIVRAGAVEWGG